MSMPYGILARFYDALSADRAYDAWVDWALAVFSRACTDRDANCMQLLDLACGTGQIACRLAAKGHRTVGVDRSAAMLAVAAETIREAGQDVPLLEQDIRALDVGMRFDAALCFCDGLNYVLDPSELGEVFRRVADHLEPGGLFLFDLNTEWKLGRVYGDQTFASHGEGFSYIWENAYNPGRREVTMHLAIFVEETPGSSDGPVRCTRYDEVHRQRAYKEQEVAQVMSSSGLRLVASGTRLAALAGREPPEPPVARTFYLARKGVIRA